MLECNILRLNMGYNILQIYESCNFDIALFYKL